MCLRALAVGFTRMHPICAYASRNTLTLKRKKKKGKRHNWVYTQAEPRHSWVLSLSQSKPERR